MKMVYSVEKSAWKQASGLVIRTIKTKKTIWWWKVLAPELLINEQLEIAIINEDYENAILRDKSKNLKDKQIRNYHY
jgi:protein-arginine kinase activator protein McsA